MSSKTLYLMQGIPGSGKSTVAKMIAAQTDGVIYSTDDLWYDEDGTYNFDADRLAEMHRLNQRAVAEAMVEGRESIIVDNTNIDSDAVRPYVMLAEIHGYDTQVVRVMVHPSVARERNAQRPADRQVPNDVIERMAKRMTDLSSYLGSQRYVDGQ